MDHAIEAVLIIGQFHSANFMTMISSRFHPFPSASGVQIPRLCSVEFNHLHLDYIPHAAIISGDFDVDLPLLIRQFKEFMDDKQRRTKTRRELFAQFRYL